MYRPTRPLSTFTDSRTWRGTYPELSMTTSHLRSPARAPSPWSILGSRLPIRSSALPSNSVVSLRPLLKRVTLWPRASACSTWKGPMKPVPPRKRMSRGFEALSTPTARVTPLASIPRPAAVHPSTSRRVVIGSPRARWCPPIVRAHGFHHATHETSRCLFLEPLDDRQRGIAIAQVLGEDDPVRRPQLHVQLAERPDESAGR